MIERCVRTTVDECFQRAPGPYCCRHCSSSHATVLVCCILMSALLTVHCTVSLLLVTCYVSVNARRHSTISLTLPHGLMVLYGLPDAVITCIDLDRYAPCDSAQLDSDWLHSDE